MRPPAGVLPESLIGATHLRFSLSRSAPPFDFFSIRPQ
jgi:hypothetical protein